MSESTGWRLTPRLVLGFGVLLIGVIFTADTLGLADGDLVFDYWPVLLIAIGATKIGGKTSSDRLFALIWIGVGAWLLAWNLAYVDVNPFQFFWPIVFIVFGLSLLLGGRGPVFVIDTRRRGERGDDSTVSVIAVMGGVERSVGSQSFEGGDVIAFMGGGKLDLRAARPASQEIELEIFAMWGGYEIVVPPEWEVSVELLPLLGSVEDKRTHHERSGEAPVLTLSGVVIMGGIEVKT